ncbi:Notchless protein-like protein, partial [Smittium culicis]
MSESIYREDLLEKHVEEEEPTMILAQFQSSEGENSGPVLGIPLNSSNEQLRLIINNILENDEDLPYSFYIDGEEISENIEADLLKTGKKTSEDKIIIVYQPQALFRVRAVTRCSSSLTGHAESILSVSFSPDGTQLASGSGDTTVRIWDLNTETPQYTCKGHTNWVLYIAWSPDGNTLASGGMDNTVRLWDPKTGLQLGRTLSGHRKWITCLAWEPLHLNPKANRLASSSKDGTVRVWDTTLRTCLFSVGGHTSAVTCVCWGGDGILYTSSQDKTIKMWNSEGKLIKTLSGHAHWVNSLAISSGFVLRTGAFDHTGTRYDDPAQAQQRALERYQESVGSKTERLVSGSDD